jgi:para-aminobenzoate synthetase/4-amino-4-deoxychorismate lyase
MHSAKPVEGLEFSLLETMRLERGRIPRLERHLARMNASARFFGFSWREPAVRDALESVSFAHAEASWRLRLLVDREGTPSVSCTPFESDGTRWRVALAMSPIDALDPYLRHKTTLRKVYESARATRPDVDDVLLWNARGEITEATIANVVLELEGTRVTPAATSGLLPGVFRAELIEAGTLREEVVTRDNLSSASRLWLINSLRGWVDVSLVA